MIDWLQINVGFKSEFLHVIAKNTNNEAHWLNLHDLPNDEVLLSGNIVGGSFDTGYELTDLKSPFESIQSHHSGIAFKIYDKGFKGTDAYCVLKCSPLKIMQGHNIFGEFPMEIAIFEIFKALAIAKPKLFQMLDLISAQLRVVDLTAFALVDPKHQQSLISYYSNVSYGKTKATNQIGKETVYFGSSKSSNIKKIYLKHAEVQHRLKKKQLNEECIKSFLNSEFLKNQVRFESRLKPPFLLKYLEYDLNKIRQKNAQTDDVFLELPLFETIKLIQKHQKFLFDESWKQVFQTMKDSEIALTDDSEVRKKLLDFYSSRVVNRLMGFYFQIKHEGYDSVQSSLPGRTFRRNIKELVDSGLSRSQLQNFKGNYSDNVQRLKLFEVVKIDFSRQLPDDYVPPKLSDFDIHSEDQRLAVTSLVREFKRKNINLDILRTA